jgi:hypothetical protein
MTPLPRALAGTPHSDALPYPPSAVHVIPVRYSWALFLPRPTSTNKTTDGTDTAISRLTIIHPLLPLGHL